VTLSCASEVRTEQSVCRAAFRRRLIDGSFYVNARHQVRVGSLNAVVDLLIDTPKMARRDSSPTKLQQSYLGCLGFNNFIAARNFIPARHNSAQRFSLA
jgi:hypothetical protein